MKRNVLFIAPTPYFASRGCHIRIYGIARIIRTLGFNIDLATYHIGEDFGPFHRIYRIQGIRNYKYFGPGPKPGMIKLDIQLLKLVKNLLSTKDYTHIYAFLHEGAAIMRMIPRQSRGKKIVIDLQGIMTDEMIDHSYIKPKGLKHMLWQRVEHWSLGLDVTYTVSSSELVKYLRRIKPDYDVRLLLDGVDTQHFTPPNEVRRKDLKARFMIPQDSVVFGYLGGLELHKGVSTLLKGFSMIAYKAGCNLLLGGYPGADILRKKARAMNIIHRTYITGKVDYHQSPEFLGAMDIGIAPKHSSGEGAQGKILTYMAMAMPIIAYDNEYSRNLLGDMGLYFNGTPESLARAMTIALENNIANKDYSILRKRVIKYHRWEQRANIINDIFT